MSDTETRDTRPGTALPPVSDLTGTVATIVAAFASREAATVDEIIELAQRLSGLDLDWTATAAKAKPATAAQPTPARRSGAGAPAAPALNPDEAVTEDAVYCLCCGRGFTMLKRHLKAEHGLSEEQYRARFGLAEDFPLVAPSYSARKAAYAKEVGLGKYRRDEPSVSAG
ncbi:MucR family transcriptional regulator [Shimia sp.]|uniref:MucR family transcriptional regulator n=1 Tax=Shimia sp. TaxID=1954381 RepID=UPI0035679B49